MDLKSLNFEALPKPVLEMIGKMDPEALKKLLDSLNKEEQEKLLAGAMGYLEKMSPEDQDKVKDLIQTIFGNGSGK